jgi:ketosteroid isomerase-like protein
MNKHNMVVHSMKRRCMTMRSITIEKHEQAQLNMRASVQGTCLAADNAVRSMKRERVLRISAAVLLPVWFACTQPEPRTTAPPIDTAAITADIEARVRDFHRADTARDAEAMIALLWPDFTIRVDGNLQDYAQVAAGSREFMGSLALFHTDWSDLRVVPLSPDLAIASFQFRDSIMTSAGDLIRARGPTTFVWERRNGEWRVRFADADHYPIDR